MNQRLFIRYKAAQVSGQHRTPDYLQAVMAKVLVAVFLNEVENEPVSLPVGVGADEPFTPHLLQQRLKLTLKGYPGKVPGSAAEGSPRRFGDIMQRPVEQVNIVDVETDTPALQQVEKDGVKYKDMFTTGIEINTRYSATIKQQSERIEKLEFEAADTEEAYQITIDDKGCPDEWHCTCVGHLRRRIEKLEATLRKVADWVALDGDGISDPLLTEVRAQIQKARNHPK